MKKRYLINVLLIILCICFLAGCKKTKEEQSENGTCIYYLNIENTELIPESYEPDSDDPVGEMVKDLQSQPKDSDLCSAFPTQVKIKSYELDDTDLKIHFNKEYKKLSSTEQMLLRAVVVKSLVSLKDVDYVEFYIGSKPLKDEYGKEIGFLNEGNFVEGIGSTIHTMKEEKISMYIPDASGEYLVVQQMTIKYNNDTLKEKAIAEALVPVNTKLLNVTEEANICFLNYDEGLLLGTAGINPKIQIYSIVNSIVENTDVMRVQFLVNGQMIDHSLEQMKIDQPLTHNLDLIKGE